jgi:hypothetical protein
MSNRLNQQREKELQPKRMEFAKNKLTSMGFAVEQRGDTLLSFIYNGSEVLFYPYSGWHTGKSIKDGRGIDKLLKQLKPKL